MSSFPNIETINWIRDFNEAFQKAKEYQLPVMIVFISPGDVRIGRLLNLFQDPEVVELSKSFVCLVADPGIHPENPDLNPLGEPKYCPRYLTLTCAEHQEVARVVTIALPSEMGKDEKTIHIFLRPEGDKIFKRGLPLSREALIRWMKEALKEVNPEAFHEALERLTSGRITRFRSKIHQADSPQARRAAIKRLVRTGDIKALKSLYEECKRDEVRIEFIRFIPYSDHTLALPWLEEIFRSAKGDARNHAVVSLEILASEDAVPALLEGLSKKNDEKTTKNIIRALGASGPYDKRVQAAILKQLGSNSVLIRSNAYIALHGMKGVDEIRRKVVKYGLKDKDKDVRACAVWALGWIGNEDDIQKLKVIKDKYRDRYLTFLAEQAIRKIRGKKTRAFDNAKEDLGKDEVPRSWDWPVLPEREGQR